MVTDAEKVYPHLEYRPGSAYRQPFLKGRRIRVAVVCNAIHGGDPYTPEEFAEGFQVPLEAVHEALDFADRHPEVIRADREREEANLRARGLLNGPPSA